MEGGGFSDRRELLRATRKGTNSHLSAKIGALRRGSSFHGRKVQGR